MKSRLAGAQKGHGLLKKKADALQMRFRLILGKIIEVSSLWWKLCIVDWLEFPLKMYHFHSQTKTLMGEVMKEAAFSLAEAKFATGEFNQVVLQNVTKAQIKIRTKKDNVAGVTLPVFESYTVSLLMFNWQSWFIHGALAVELEFIAIIFIVIRL